jgi:4-hydroxy-3-methylbut-2-enyl diphosphate reductase
MIGHAGHPEVEGTMGQVPDSMYLVESVGDVALLEVQHPEALAYVSQTTLSVDETRDIIAALQVRFPQIASPRKDDICYATQNRQDAVKSLAASCDLVIVVGSPNSSNSNRLREVASIKGVEAYMVDNATELNKVWFSGKNCIGVTAGASAPEVLVQAVIQRIRELGEFDIRELEGVEEHTTFALPPGLRE